MAYEDFSTYTELDPNAHISIAGVGNVHIDWDAWKNEDARVYKAFGAAHFGNFEHLVDVMSAYDDNGANGAVWAVSNYLDDTKYWITNDKRSMFVMMYRSGTRRILLYEQPEGAAHSNDEWVAASASTWYYLTIERADTALTCEIYSDAARTVLIDTLSVVCDDVATSSFNYLYGCNTNNNGDAENEIVDIENLDIQEAVDVSANIKIWDGVEDVELVRDDTSPVKLYNGVEVVGIELVATDDGAASAIRVYDGVEVKALKKIT